MGKPGRDAATLQAFFDELGSESRSSIRAISIDMNGGYEKAIRDQVVREPGFTPEICVDPFHVVQLAQRAVDDVRRAEWEGRRQVGDRPWALGQERPLVTAQGARATERPPAGGAARGQPGEQAPLPRLLAQGGAAAHQRLDDRNLARDHLNAWLAWASRSKLKPFVKLPRTIRRYRDGILAAIRLGPSNSRMEALNSKVRLLSHPSFGFHGPQPRIALIYLCCTGLIIHPPQR